MYCLRTVYHIIVMTVTVANAIVTATISFQVGSKFSLRFLIKHLRFWIRLKGR